VYFNPGLRMLGAASWWSRQDVLASVANTSNLSMNFYVSCVVLSVQFQWITKS
jgi:hypothetical protein